jgi:hypothetical protein
MKNTPYNTWRSTDIISNPPSNGTLGQPNNTPIDSGNLRIQVLEAGPNKSLQVAVSVVGPGSGINASDIGLFGAKLQLMKIMVYQYQHHL